MEDDPFAGNLDDASSDEDFDPDNAATRATAAQDHGDTSDEEADEDGNSQQAVTRRPGRQGKASTTAEDAGFDNSGDEATINSGQRSRKKRKHKAQENSDDSGGEGGLIKTRAQRSREKTEKKPLAHTNNATVNVDELWAKLNAAAPPISIDEAQQSLQTNHDRNQSQPQQTHADNPQAKPNQQDQSVGTVTIKRTYKFAGKWEQEERVVPADSAEAKLYLAEQEKKKKQLEEQQSKQSQAASVSTKPGVRKPMKRKSMFAAAAAAAAPSVPTPASQGPKLNTLQKSKLDWAQQVDREGIAEELDEHSRAKDSYSSRMDFLGRMDAKREDDVRRTRLD